MDDTTEHGGANPDDPVLVEKCEEYAEEIESNMIMDGTLDDFVVEWACPSEYDPEFVVRGISSAVVDFRCDEPVEMILADVSDSRLIVTLVTDSINYEFECTGRELEHILSPPLLCNVEWEPSSLGYTEYLVAIKVIGYTQLR